MRIVDLDKSRFPFIISCVDEECEDLEGRVGTNNVQEIALGPKTRQ
jgi:hypothetical protein